MIQSPLQLERYFLTDVDLRARPPDSRTDDSSSSPAIEAHVDAFKDSAESLDYQIRLEVRLLGDGPYFGSVALVGFFRMAEDIEADRRDVLARVNGPAVLFGAAREIIANTTARGPWGEVLIPLVTFVDQKDEPVEIQRQQAAQER